MNRTVNVSVKLGVEILKGGEHGHWFLGCGGVVEINQILAANILGKNGKFFAPFLNVCFDCHFFAIRSVGRGKARLAPTIHYQLSHLPFVSKIGRELNRKFHGQKPGLIFFLLFQN